MTDLSLQAGLVLRNVALVEEIQRSRQRIVSSQDEARRRLERDLHDGAAAARHPVPQLRMARDRAEASGDPDLTTASEPPSKSSHTRSRSCASWLVDPPGDPHAERRRRGRSLARRPVHGARRGPRAPDARFAPEVEATAYFVVSEALANVSKHAEASHVWIAVEDNRGVLAIDVRDDGIGARRWTQDPVCEAWRTASKPSGAGSMSIALPALARPCTRNPVRVAVADDAILFREGLVRVLADGGFDVVGQAGDADELLTIVREAPADRQPDVAVVDIRMPPTHTTEGLVAAKKDPRRSSRDLGPRPFAVHLD